MNILNRKIPDKIIFKVVLFPFFFYLMYFSTIRAQTFYINDSASVVRYIVTHSHLAKEQEIKYGIPASVIMAQAIVESDAGKSILAVCANNHFGIKTHKEWNGDSIYYHDNKLNESFRKYRYVYDSYEDHSKFLLSRPRYRFLFSISTTDYVSWCFGLQEAGYATAPDYAVRLLKVITDFRLDTLSLPGTLCSRNFMKEFPFSVQEKSVQEPLIVEANPGFFMNSNNPAKNFIFVQGRKLLHRPKSDY